MRIDRIIWMYIYFDVPTISYTYSYNSILRSLANQFDIIIYIYIHLYFIIKSFNILVFIYST